MIKSIVRFRSYLFSITLVWMLIGAICYVAIENERNNSEGRANLIATNTASSIGAGLDSKLQKVELALSLGREYYKRAISQSKVDHEQIDAFIRDLELSTQDADAIRILDRNGIVRHGSSIDRGKITDLSDRDFFQKTRDGTTSAVVSGPIFARISKKWVMVIALRMEDLERNFLGTIYANVAVDELRKIMLIPNLGPKDAILIRNEKFHIVQRVPDLPNAVGSTTVSKEFVDALSTHPREGIFTSIAPLDKVERIVAYKRLAHYPLYASVGFATDSPVHGGAPRYLSISLAGLIAAIFSFAIIFLIVRSRINMAERLDKESKLSLELSASLEARDKLNLQLAESVESANSANMAKSVFLATMSHEIRTPLNAIVGASYLLGLSKLTNEQARDVNAISSSSKNLLALVNDVLDFSKIEAGEFVLEKKPFSLPEVLRDLRSMFSPLAAGKGLELVFPTLDHSVPTVLDGDADRLRQILINLLNNAIKFTASGTVSLAVSRVPDQAAHLARLSFTVTDTGIGIEQGFMSKLFEPFQQADASTSRRYGGTGLGLSIVKRITELMGGNVGVHSEVGKGTSFEVQIPFTKSEAVISSARKSSFLPRTLHILVAEDDPIERRVLMQACSEFGWDAEGTDNGLDMVEMVQTRLSQNNPIDCVMLDWRMPKLDGVAALEELAHRVGEKAMPSVIMVTANDRDALMNALKRVQPDSILTKPVNRSVLFNSVNEAVVSHGKGLSHVIKATVIQGSHANWLHGVRVLVVDDSSMNLEVIRRILASEGAKAVVCESGQEALQALSTPNHFDAVLMDMQMPGMDGCETTERIKALHAHLSTPVIALTAGATVTEKERALKSGMVDFLTKPVEPTRLIRVLREHIEAHRGEPLRLAASQEQVTVASQTEPARPSPQAPAGQGAGTWPQIEGIDSALASSMMGGDVHFFAEMLSALRKEHESSGRALEDLVGKREFESAARLAHKLKGQAGNVGAMALHRAAGALEMALLEKVENVDELVAAVGAALKTIMEAKA